MDNNIREEFNSYNNIQSSTPDQSTAPSLKDEFVNYKPMGDATTSTKVPGFEYDEARRLIKGAIDPLHSNIQQIYAENQSGIEQFGAALNQSIVGEIIGGTLEGTGYLFDLEDTYNALFNGQAATGNFLSQAGKSIKDFAREATPIYTDPFKEGKFSPGDWSWWMSNMPSIASSLSLMIPSGAATKGLSAIAKGVGLGKSLTKTGQVAAKGITQAVISRQMESMMEASGIQEETLNSLLSQGIDYNTAVNEASKAAATTYKANWAMLAQDIVQYTTLIKPFGKATSDLTIKAAKKLGKDITPIIANKASAIGQVMFSEAGEEGYQYTVGKRAREIAEYNAGLRPKSSLSETIGDALGEGDFWTSAFFGALGAGVMQTAGKGLNATKERIRGLESEDKSRLRDIDSWGQTIRSLSEIDIAGETSGNQDINTKDHQLGLFGLRLAENGNLGWFLDVADNFTNMSEEDQQMFGFTQDELNESRKRFPNMRQDLERIGEHYEEIINTKEISRPATRMAVYEQFIADKKLDNYKKLDSEYSSRLNNISGLALENVTSNVREVIVQEKIELNNLNKLRRELKKQNASESVINNVNNRINELKSRVKESKNELSKEELNQYNEFNTRSMDFRKTSRAYLEKEFTLSEHKEALDRVKYYTDPSNQEEIINSVQQTDKESIENAIEDLQTAQEFDDVDTQAEDLSGQANTNLVDILNRSRESKGEEVIPTQEVNTGLSNILNKAKENRTVREIEEDNDKHLLENKEGYESIDELVNNKYTGKPALLNNDINKLINSVESKEILEGLTENEIDSVKEFVRNANLHLTSKEKSEESITDFVSRIERLNTKASEKVLNNILNILNKEAKSAKSNEDFNKTQDSIDNQGRTSIGVDTSGDPIGIRKVSSTVKTIKDYSKGGNTIVGVNRVGEVTAKELGVDQEALNKGKVKIGTKVSFRVDKTLPIEKSLKDNFEKRSFQIVAEVNGKEIVIGLVPANKESMELRKILHDEINNNYSKNKKYVKANITSETVGMWYEYSRTQEYGSPKERIQDKDQKHFAEYGGFVYDFVENDGRSNKLSGKTNLPIGIYNEEQFNDSPEGSIIIPVPHPHYPNKYLYLRGFQRKLSDYRGSKAEKAEERYQIIVNNVKEAFNNFIENPTKETKREIRNYIITRDIDLKNNTLILSPRTETGREYRIPIDEINSVERQNELEEWIADSYLNIKKNLLNTSPEPHNIGYGVVSPTYYNTLISDFIQLSIDKESYLVRTRPIITIPDTKNYTVETKPISQEVKDNKTSIAKDSEELDKESKINTKGNQSKKTEVISRAEEKRIEARKKADKEKEILNSLSDKELRALPGLAGIETRGDEALEFFDKIDWTNEQSIVDGFTEISNIVNGKFISGKKELEVYLKTINKLTDNTDLWSKDYIMTYIIARSKDISNVKLKETKTEVKEEFKEEPQVKEVKTKDSLQNIQLDDIVDTFDDILNKVRNNKNNKTRTRPKENRNLDKWNKLQETNWFEKNFPNVPLNVLDNLKNVIANGSEYWGVFHNGAIYIEDNAASGTLYHEAYHAMFNLFATPKQREALLKEAASKYKIKRNNFDTLNDYNVALEEAMADDFADIVAAEEVPKSFVKRLGKLITDFFKSLQQVIKSIHKNPIYNIEEFFWRGNNGFYTKAAVDTGSFADNVTRYKPKGWTARQEKIAVDAINGHLMTSMLPAIRNKSIDYADLSDIEIINTIGLDVLYKNIYNTFLKLYKSDELTQQESDNVAELLLNFYDVKNNEFLELHTSLIRELEEYNVKVKETKISETGESKVANEEGLIEVEENAEDKLENWQNTAQERSSKQNALKEVKNFIKNMFIPGFKNIYGLDALVNYDETYDTLLKDLAGTTDVADMVDYIKLNLITNPEYKQILDAFEEDPSFKTKFFSAFNKNHTKYNMVTFVNGNYAVYQANRKGLSNRIMSEWAENIINNSEITTIDTKGNIKLNENIKPLIENIRLEIGNVIDNWTNDKTEDYYKPLSEALDKVGLTMTPNVLLYIGSITTKKVNGKSSLNKFFLTGENKFSYILDKLDNLLNPFDAEGGMDSGESNAIKNATNMVVKASTELYESSFKNLSGKSVYAHLEQNFLSKLTHRFLNPNRKEKALESYLKDQLFYHVIDGKRVFHNRLLKDIMEKENPLYDIMVTEGLVDDQGNRTSYQKLDNNGLNLYSIHNYFNNGSESEGWYRGTVLSDAPNGIVFRNRKESKDKILANLSLLAQSEYNRILSIRDQMKTLPDNIKTKNYHTLENSSTKTGYHIIEGMRGHKANDYQKNMEIIDKWLSKESDNYFQSLVDSSIIIIKDGKVQKESRLDQRIINKYTTEERIKEFISTFYYNDYLSRAEFSLMTVGDPAFYKPSDKKNNKTVDYVKRAKEIYSPKTILDVNAEGVGVDYRTIYLDDNEIQSPSYDMISKTANELYKKKIISKEALNGILKSYSRVNQTDAQAYVTLPFYKRTMLGAGLWTSKHEAAYTRIENGLSTSSDLALMLNPLKPFAYGQVWSDDIGRMVPVQNKNSEFLLLPQLALAKKDNGEYVNPKLANLLNFMNGANIDSVNFESAVKTGLSKNLDTSIFNTKESTESFINDIYKKDPEAYYHVLSMEDRGIQQEVPQHFVDSDNLFGTQIRKLIVSDLFDGTTYMGMKPNELRKLYEDLLIADLIEAYSELEDKIVLKKNEDGSPAEINYKFLYDILLDEARNRNKGEEFEKAIQYDAATNKLALPLFNPVTDIPSQNLITSLFKSRITKQKIDGGAFVQLSSFGLSDQLRLEYNKEGGLEYAQVMLPAWSKKFFKDFLLPNGDVDFKSIEKTSPEILDMIGYRIPTEDKYSMLPLRVIGFLPITSGGAIMLPADITQISGSDFDVDKMYVMMKSFTESKFNKKKFISDLKAFAKSNEEFKDVNISNDNINIVLSQIENGQTINDEDILIYDFYTDNKEKYGENKFTLNEYDSSKSALENTKAARNNHKIDIMLSVLRNSHTFESIMSGGTFEPLQVIADLTNIVSGKDDRNLNPMSLNSMNAMHLDNMTGKSMTGIAANENAFHAIAQNANLSLKTEVLFDGERMTSLSDQKARIYVYINRNTKEVTVLKGDDHSQKISKNKAYYLAAIVDNAKDPVASYINYNSYTSGLVGLLTQAGVDPATVTWFLKQPVIESIAKKYFASGEDWNVESTYIQELKDFYGIQEKDYELEAENLNTKDLLDNLNKKDVDFQRKVFKSFLVYKRIAKDWTSLVLSSRADTKGAGPTIADSESIISSIERVMSEDFSIEGVDQLFEKTDTDITNIIWGFTEYGIKKPIDIINLMFPYSIKNGLYKTIKDKISDNLKSRDLSVKERNSLNKQITAFILSGYKVFNPNERSYYLNDFAKEFFDFKEKDPIFAENYLIRRLNYKSKISDPRIPIERVEFVNTSLSDTAKKDIQNAWQDLFESEKYRDMALKLFKYSYFSNGLGFTSNSFSHLIPTDMITNKGIKDDNGISFAEYLEINKDMGEEEANTFIDQYYRNNYKNKSLIPAIEEDKSNISKSLTDIKTGEINGYIVFANKKTSSLVLDDKRGEETFYPFISEKKADDIILYALKEKRKTRDTEETYAIYEIVDKLGFPNYIQEYMINTPGLKTAIDFNKVSPKQVIENTTVSKTTEPTIKHVETEVKQIVGNGKYTILNISEDNFSYRINFEFKNEIYDIDIRTAYGLNVYRDFIKNESFNNTDTRAKLFKEVSSAIKKNNCG